MYKMRIIIPVSSLALRIEGDAALKLFRTVLDMVSFISLNGEPKKNFDMYSLRYLLDL